MTKWIEVDSEVGYYDEPLEDHMDVVRKNDMLGVTLCQKHGANTSIFNNCCSACRLEGKWETKQKPL